MIYRIRIYNRHFYSGIMLKIEEEYNFSAQKEFVKCFRLSEVAKKPAEFYMLSNCKLFTEYVRSSILLSFLKQASFLSINMKHLVGIFFFITDKRERGRS